MNEVKIKVKEGEITFPYTREKDEPIAVMLAALDLLEKLHGKIEVYINGEKEKELSSHD